MKIIKCPHCGAELYDGTFRCGTCGQIVPKEEPKKKKEKNNGT